jgi:subtilase family serine protease
MKKSILILLLVMLLIPAAQAHYSFNGNPLEIAAQGIINGGLYIDGGHGLSFPPYSHEFNVPDGSLKWARLYFGVWGGTEKYEGWGQAKLNGHDLGKVELLGINDEHANVYCAGHGVYWVYFDAIESITNGKNVAVIETSQGEPNNKLDGRVYCAVLAAVYEDKKAPEITYCVYEGNVNLHGKGWSGKEENLNDETSVYFNDMPNPGNINRADLTVMYLTGSRGLPNYLIFNDHQLGATPQYLLDMGYQDGVTDIANAISDDATTGTGELTSYFDIESFNVLEYTQTDNSLVFLRGRDLNEDGEIGDDEGEDYLHPVIASLVLKHKKDLDPKPDLLIDVLIDEIDLIEGKDVEIPVIIGNPGGICEKEFKIAFNVDGTDTALIDAQMDASGIYKTTINWHATKGVHQFTITADPENVVLESNEDNNIYIAEAKVVVRPDLSVKIGEPIKSTGNTNKVEASAVLMILMALGMLRRKKAVVMALLLITICLCGCTEDTIETEQNDYLIPITISNNGESKASTFDVNLYLDGELNTVLRIEELDGGSSIEEELGIITTSGEHILKVTVDEKNYIIESDEMNNEDEIVYNFS